jgi:multidrug efflux pump
VRANVVNPGSLGQRGFLPPMRLVLQGDDFETLKVWRDIMMDKMSAHGGFENVRSNFDESKPEVRISVDRLKAADLGVQLDQIGTTLQVMFGSREAGSFRVAGQDYKVIGQAMSEDRRTSHDLTNVFVRSRSTNQLIPLSQLVTITEAAGPQDLVRTDRLRSITVMASLAAGFPLGQAIDDVKKMVADGLPPEARIGWQGESRNYLESQSGIFVTFGLALLIVFLVLAAQFESWIHPFIIMLTVPLAVTGGLLGLALTGTSLNVYSQIGMILLIGLMAKNGILIVEFANQLRDQGLSVRDAVFESASIRLRPILMTSIATACGAVPLAFATGAGAESRTAIGVVVIGGTIVSTCLTLFVIPSLYVLLARFTQPIHEVARRLSGLEEAHPVRHQHAAEPAE